MVFISDNPGVPDRDFQTVRVSVSMVGPGCLHVSVRRAVPQLYGKHRDKSASLLRLAHVVCVARDLGTLRI